MASLPFTAADLAQFHEDGFLFVENMYTHEEVELLLRIARADAEKAADVKLLEDGEGLTSKLWLTTDTDREDIYNAFCHGRRLVDGLEQLLSDEVYLYHYKMMVKEPRVGGAWVWHQDYGYWYYHCLYPNMASCMIAVDRAHRANGCLQVLRGSHKLGRLEHERFPGGQRGAERERVDMAREHLETIYCEMEPGTGLFFHCNLLHSSAPNTSDEARWALICCYNSRLNPCNDTSALPAFQPLEKWDDRRVIELGRRQWRDMRTEPA